MQSGALEHHRSARDTTRHLEYWRERLGKYALVHLTPEHLGKERQFSGASNLQLKTALGHKTLQMLETLYPS